MPNPVEMMKILYQSSSVHRQADSAKSGKEAELENACSEFESLFVRYMMQQMRETIPENGLIARSQAEKIYTGMMDNEIARSVSHGRGMGLARVMYEQMSLIDGHGDVDK